MGDVSVEVAVSVRAEHSEGPIWDGASALLWWIDITGQRLHRFDPTSGADCSWPLSGQPGGVVVDREGGVIVGLPDGLAAFDPDSGATRVVVPIEPDRPGNRLNDVKVDPEGRIWAGTMAYDKAPGRAALHRVDGAGAVTAVEGLTISNGPAVDGRAGVLYLADTALGVVDAFDFDPHDGELSARRRFVDVTREGIWPDGMTVDDEGHLWVAMGRGGAVHRYRPDGRLDGVVGLPVTNPTSVAFGGSDGADLYITSSWFDVPAEERARQPLAGAVFCCRPGPTGPGSPRALPLRR